jgi:hypothetical protein
MRLCVIVNMSISYFDSRNEEELGMTRNNPRCIGRLFGGVSAA